MTKNAIKELRARMKEQGITIRALAVKCGYNQHSLNRYLGPNGQQMDHNTLSKVCNALNLDWKIEFSDKEDKDTLLDVLKD